MIDIRVLGTLEIHGPDTGAPVVGLTQPKQVALLLYLALAEPTGPQSRASLMAFLWPEADEESARHSLRNTLYGLRRALGEATFVSRGAGYVGLDPRAVRCDALEVRRLLGERRWEEAVAAWGGELAPGFQVSDASEFEHWLDDQRNGLRRAVTDAAWRRVDELERSGDAGVVTAARRAWALEPANEAGARRLMRFLDAAMGRAAALRVYDDVADYLRREFESEPATETRALAEELRARMDRPAVPPESVPARTELRSSETTTKPARRRRVSARAGLVVAGIVLASAMSVLALRPERSRIPEPQPLAPPGQPAAFRLPARFHSDSSAYRSYLRGLALLFQGSHVASRDTFAALVDREPLYAPGLAGLAHAYLLTVISGVTPPADGLPKAEAAARRALSLDSALASSYLALGAVEMFWRWNLPRAGELIDKALALDPGDPEAHAVRGVWFRWMEEPDSAVAEARISSRLDPLTSFWSLRLARQLYLARRYSEAEGVFRQTLRDYPKDPAAYEGLFTLYWTTGRPRDALAMKRAARELAGDSGSVAQLPLPTSDSQAARVLADLARTQLHRIVISAERGDFVSPSAFAFAYAGLKDRDETLRWLDSMRVGKDPQIHNIILHPRFDFVRNDARYRSWESNLTWLRPRATAAEAPR